MSILLISIICLYNPSVRRIPIKHPKYPNFDDTQLGTYILYPTIYYNPYYRHCPKNIGSCQTHAPTWWHGFCQSAGVLPKHAQRCEHLLPNSWRTKWNRTWKMKWNLGAIQGFTGIRIPKIKCNSCGPLIYGRYGSQREALKGPAHPLTRTSKHVGRHVCWYSEI